MGKLIATTQATLDGVIDPVGEWVQADGDHGDYSFERQARSSGLVLGRKTYEGLAAYWPSASGKWADMVNSMSKYVGSSTLSGDLEWNATLLEGDLEAGPIAFRASCLRKMRGHHRDGLRSASTNSELACVRAQRCGLHVRSARANARADRGRGGSGSAWALLRQRPPGDKYRRGHGCDFRRLSRARSDCGGRPSERPRLTR